MNFQNSTKSTGRESINGRDVTFMYEHLEGEKSKVIEVNAQAIKDGRTETITAKYSVETNTFTQLQLFNLPVGESGPIVTAIETAITGIVESFNTTA